MGMDNNSTEKEELQQKALQLHYELKGKIEVISRKKIENREDLALLYTPGVAEACRKIEEDKEQSFYLTRRSNLVAVITDGTAVLGLGDIGPEAAMPVMEGKCALFKEFAGIDAFPLCINSKIQMRLWIRLPGYQKALGELILKIFQHPDVLR